ncbi:hypothetical protein ACFQ0T_13700 [Kitasatospora gansuensis]
MRTSSALRFGIALLTGSLALAAVPLAGAAAERGPDARRSVLLELDTEAAAPAWRRAADQATGERRSPDAVRRAASAAGAEQRRVADRAADQLAGAVRRSAPGARELYRTGTLLTAVAVSTPAAALPALGGSPGSARCTRSR